MKYFVGTALLERVGIGWSKVLRYDPSSSGLQARKFILFSVASSLAELTSRDLETLESYGSELREQYERYFEAGEICVVGRTPSGDLACVSWITASNEHPLFSPEKSVEIWKVFTLPEHRGRGFHPLNMAFAAQVASRSHPGSAIYAECSAFNEASLKGIRRAGFRDCGWVLDIGRWKHSRRTRDKPSDRQQT